MAKADFLKERAEVFLENAEHNFSGKKWFAVAFNLIEGMRSFAFKIIEFLKKL